VLKYNIGYESFLFAQVLSYYAQGTIYVVVIDPSVGTTRLRIIVIGEYGLYVGSDNGVFL